MTKKCPKCDKENEDVASFCANCGYSFNSEFNSSNDELKNSKNLSITIENNGSKSTIRLPGLKVIVAIIAIILIIGIVAFNSGSMGTGSNDGGKISLIKERINGYGYAYEGESYYSYYVEGVLKNLPDDIDDYELKSIFYDENDKFMYEDRAYLESVKEFSDKSEPSVLGSCLSDDLRNLSFVKLELKDPNGDVVFNETLYYDMDKMDLSGMNDDDSNTNKTNK